MWCAPLAEISSAVRARVLAAHVGEIGDVDRRFADVNRAGVGPRLAVAQDRDERREGRHGMHRGWRPQPCRSRGRLPDDEHLVGESRRQRGRATHAAQRSVESQFGEKCESIDAPGFDHIGGDQQPDRNRKIEGRTLTLLGAPLPRRHVHRHASIRPVEPAREHRGAHPVARLPAAFIGLSDDGETRQTLTDVHLDGDRSPGDAHEGGRRDGGVHADPPRA